MVHETRRLLEAAAALHALLLAANIPHAFHGDFVVAMLANAPHCNEIFCIVEGNGSHPFRRVRHACAASEDITTRSSPWTNRLHATYTRLIPSVDIEILPAGEEGPRRLDQSTVTLLAGIPVLTFSEFIRAKLKAWIIRQAEHDAEDIAYVLTRYWNRVDFNRIPEHDMDEFVRRRPAAASAWAQIKQKYGL
ncbi:hypothetical protein PHLGIDRAFT_26148 [Phlebiopsis gigantea 11061_1 CR5-6]|uniref:Uncharacterized protein n=1 Tax=Phlebiopsis gigantea (strain 11061_1 CR5-6) TaxID=745531 RepID=A0A0C3NFD8_PHLG1|nr:hypothetical protein PHLGIDRAFT_26148 [Phlebiopsis gigantea 11061_1 CR5-6]